jgi:hypothetical protein
LKTALAEQETVVQISRDGEEARIYTSDTTMMTKLDKRVAEENSVYEVASVDTYEGDVVAKTYLAPKNAISFRQPAKRKPMSEEERERVSKRMSKVRASRFA